ncbi:hypothetical protein ACVNPZ_10870 [Staphylococcus aureus]
MENEFNEHREWHLHIYGKSERKDSKMGHMIAVANE